MTWNIEILKDPLRDFQLPDPDEAKYHKVGDTYGTNVIPKKCDAFDFKVTRIVDKDIFSYSFLTGEREQRCKKGERFYDFTDLKSLKKVMNREFNRIFKKGWILKGSYGRTIEEEYKLLTSSLKR